MKPRNLIIVALAAWSLQSHAALVDADPGNYRTRLAALAPGDTLRLAPGTYTQGLPLIGVAGTASAPIVIEGPADQSAVFHARDCCNTVQLENASYIEIRNLTLDGRNLSGPFGVDSRGACHHITLENLRIVNHGNNQAVVGISTKGPAWNWVIRRNTILRAGTGMYLGNSDGTQPFVAGIIEHNLILDTIGYNIEIKHQNGRPSGIGMPTGASRTIIRHNVFSKANNASTGGNARPALLVGHFPPSGTGSSDRYEIYGNFFYQNPVEALFQGEGNIALHDNVFVNTHGDAINIMPHNDRPRDVIVYHNTVVAAGRGINVTGGASGTTQRIIGNAVFASEPIRGPNQQSNVTDSYSAASTYLNAPTAPIGQLDLAPKPGRLSGTPIDLAPFGAFVDGARDFDGRAREGRFRGAYEVEGAHGGWKLALAIKPENASSPPPGTPRVTLTSDAAKVQAGERTTLRWSSQDVDSCTASGGWTGARPVSGEEQTTSLWETTQYTLGCTGAAGSASASVTIEVAAASPPPSDPPPTDPPPSDPPPSDPPPADPPPSPPPGTGNQSSGGGGAFGWPGMVALLAFGLGAGLRRHAGSR